MARYRYDMDGGWLQWLCGHMRHVAVCAVRGHAWMTKMDGTRLCRRRP